ncbi:unnamed protein product [Sphenostylis stenocarpa]|uniref:Alcohol dehydrogenase-like N-terminal domain-containing protein n=1 Tax=Sphenostylis stenocarpa TaxID=92480 RepID=A0AA86W4K7_9FABA|nr:unnamed protein product [Sphenostylis stenocarpa]
MKVEAISINPIDWKIHKGLLRPLFFPGKFPHTPCTDVAEEVVQIGSQVKDFKVGDKVLAKLTYRFAVGSESLTASRPSEVSAAKAAALPIAGLTAS